MLRYKMLPWNGVVIAVFAILLAIPLTAEAGSQVILSGKFKGQSGHDVSGGVSILKTDSGYVVMLEKDFRLDRAPDPKLAFGQNGYNASTLFAKLKSNKGAQVYSLPEDLNPTGYNEFWVWCEKHNVPLGVAKLK